MGCESREQHSRVIRLDQDDCEWRAEKEEEDNQEKKANEEEDNQEKKAKEEEEEKEKEKKQVKKAKGEEEKEEVEVNHDFLSLLLHNFISKTDLKQENSMMLYGMLSNI